MFTTFTIHYLEKGKVNVECVLVFFGYGHAISWLSRGHNVVYTSDTSETVSLKSVAETNPSHIFTTTLLVLLGGHYDSWLHQGQHR